MKGSTKLPYGVTDTIGCSEKTIHKILKKISSHPTIIKIYRDELERINTDLSSTKGLLVTLREVLGVPTKRSDRNNISSKMGDLRDVTHDLEQNSLDFVNRLENLSGVRLLKIP